MDFIIQCICGFIAAIAIYLFIKLVFLYIIKRIFLEDIIKNQRDIIKNQNIQNKLLAQAILNNNKINNNNNKD
jgi:hypothetical protein